MKKLILRFPLISLIWLGLICGALWRWEVEYHGWQGLIWIRYFHYAIPAGFGLFLLWGNLFIEAGWIKRIVLNLLFIISGYFLYRYMALSLYVNYNVGPSGMAMLMSIPRSTLLFYSRLILYLIPFMPLGAWIILRLFRFRVRIINLIFAVVSVVLSVPVACLILEWTRHKGGSDPLHALKSGLLAVLWVYSLGLVVIGIKKGLHKRPDPKILLTWIRMVYRKKLH